jgi:quercetin dioxygenase-like cupin family protein
MTTIPTDRAATGFVDPAEIPVATLRRPWGTTRMQLLSVSLATNTFTNIIEWTAGTRLPKHHHTGSVHAYTLAGRWHYLDYDWVAGPGTYVFEPPGTNHTLEVLEDTRALFVTQGAFIYVDEHDTVTSFSDAGTMLEECRRALAAEGRSLPECILQ